MASTTCFGREVLLRFSRRVNFGHDHFISIAESSRKFFEQSLGARVGVRLPDSPDATGGVTCPGSSKRGANFGWMMRIVINNDNAIYFAARTSNLRPVPENWPSARAASASGRSSSWDTVNAASALQNIMLSRDLKFNHGCISKHGSIESETDLFHSGQAHLRKHPALFRLFVLGCSP